LLYDIKDVVIAVHFLGHKNGQSYTASYKTTLTGPREKDVFRTLSKRDHNLSPGIFDRQVGESILKNRRNAPGINFRFPCQIELIF
jgi:hypothetical protein